jgi:nicotinate-nucleotide adenylyltransferase
VSTSLRIGLYGGSFDPIHQGHLIAAQDALEQLALDRLIFIPSAQAPLRPDTVRASAQDRMEMIRLAIRPEPRFQVSGLEIDRGGISYTFDTVSALRQQHPNDTLLWIIGQDHVAKLNDWRRIEELAALTEFAYLRRPGSPELTDSSTPNISGLRLHPLRSHQVEISSTEIRQRIHEKRPLHFLLPDLVIRYIYDRDLYH